MSTATATAITIRGSCRTSGRPLAHFLAKKWSHQRALLAVCLLAVAVAALAAECSSAAELAAASAAATAATNQHQHQQHATAAASAQVGLAHHHDHSDELDGRQQEADELLGELLELEARPSQHLDECALWYSLNVRHRELVGASSAAAKRPGALHKEAECDHLEQLVAETRDRLAHFKHLLRKEGKQLEFVGELAAEYLELAGLAAAGDEQLARELDSFRLAGGKGSRALEELERLLDFIRGAPVHGQEQLIGEPQATALVSAASTAAAHSMVLAPADELAELDAALRQLIDREPELSAEELGHLAELGGALERHLAEGRVDLSSGRFRALSGTVDAVRAIVMHRLADDEEEASRLAEERERAAREAELAQRRWSIHNRASQLRGQRAPQVAAMANSAAGSAGAASAAAAATSSLAGRQQLNLGHGSQLAVSTPLTGASTSHGVASAASAAATATSGGAIPSHRSFQPTAATVNRGHIGQLRMQQQQRRFADQLAH